MGHRRRHLTVIAALVAYWIVYALATQSVIEIPERLHVVWNTSAPFLLGLSFALAVGLYVGQWWVVLLSVSPVIPLALLQMTGYQADDREGPPLDDWPWWVASIAVPLSVGAAIRRGLGPSPRRSGLQSRPRP